MPHSARTMNNRVPQPHRPGNSIIGSVIGQREAARTKAPAKFRFHSINVCTSNIGKTEKGTSPKRYSHTVRKKKIGMAYSLTTKDGYTFFWTAGSLRSWPNFTALAEVRTVKLFSTDSRSFMSLRTD